MKRGKYCVSVSGVLLGSTWAVKILPGSISSFSVDTCRASCGTVAVTKNLLLVKQKDRIPTQLELRLLVTDSAAYALIEHVHIYLLHTRALSGVGN